MPGFEVLIDVFSVSILYFCPCAIAASVLTDAVQFVKLFDFKLFFSSVGAISLCLSPFESPDDARILFEESEVHISRVSFDFPW